MEKFHYFLYGKEFTLETDRVTPMDPGDNTKLPIIAVNLITAHILMIAPSQDTFSRKLDRLRKSTVRDNQLTRLSHYISTGFPCEKKNLPIDLQDYWNYRDTLSISLPADPGSLFHMRCKQRCYSTSMKDTRVGKDAC